MTHPGYTAKDLPINPRPWYDAKPEEFWLVSGGGSNTNWESETGERVTAFYDCTAHVLVPRPGHVEDRTNPRFQLVMHDGSTHDDIVTANDISDAHRLRLVDGREQRPVFRR